MSVQQNLERRLRAALDPSYLKLTNESQRHKVPPGSETHFSAIIVSSVFSNQSLLARQRAVYQAIGADLRSSVHAFTMRTLTPDEWDAESRPKDHTAPACRGGSIG